jgi:hypothetical protein
MHLVEELKPVEVELRSTLADLVDVELTKHILDGHHLAAHEHAGVLADNIDILSVWRVPTEKSN